jgi:hypothetical protein
MSLLFSLCVPFLSESEFDVSELTIKSWDVSVPSSYDQFHVALQRHVSYVEVDSLVLSVFVVLGETNCLTLLVAVTEVDVSPNSLNVLVSDCLHDVGVVAHEVVSSKHILVDVEEHSKSSISQLLGVSMVLVLHESSH